MIRVKKIGKDGLEHEYLQFTEDEIARIRQKYEEEEEEEEEKKKVEQAS